MARKKTPGVFDVSRPNKVPPSPTSRPVITGRQSSMASDPMVREASSPMNHTPVPVQFHPDSEPDEHKVEVKSAAASLASGENFGFSPTVEPPANSTPPPPDNSTQEVENAGLSAILATNKADDPVGLATGNPDDKKPPDVKDDINSPSYSAVDSLLSEENAKTGSNEVPRPATTEVPPLNIPQLTDAVISKPKSGQRKWVIAAVVALLVGGYLAADAGAIGGLNVPVHLIGHPKTAAPAVASPVPATPPAGSASSPASSGYTLFKDSSVPIAFSYPTAWGKSTVVAEDGTTKRSSSSKAEGVFSYKFTFDSNKDVQILVTSNKYLPLRKTTQYYDYLQWCAPASGVGKFNQQTLRFTTSGGVDTPTTVTCDQGPFEAVKLGANLIEISKYKDSTGMVIGNLYINNIASASLTTSDGSLDVAHALDQTGSNELGITHALSTMVISGPKP